MEHTQERKRARPLYSGQSKGAEVPCSHKRTRRGRALADTHPLLLQLRSLQPPKYAAIQTIVLHQTTLFNSCDDLALQERHASLHTHACMRYRYKKQKALCEKQGGCEMGGFTRLLHSGAPDNLMDEIPTVVVNPLPKELVEHNW
eukprot:1084655-Pelagomonas_calceolata.AAC.3